MKNKTIKKIAWVSVLCLIGYTIWVIDYNKKELIKQEQLRIDLEMEREKQRVEEEKKRKEMIKEISTYKVPRAGMDADYVGYTQLGKPHEIVDASSPVHFNLGSQYDAKWYFEDEKYDYKCTAEVFSLDSRDKVVRSFRVYADPKRTYKFGKLYSDERKYTRENGVIVCYDTYFRNDFANN